MIRRRVPALLAPLCCAALIAGCGGGASSTSSTAGKSTPASSTPATSSSSTTPTAPTNVAQAVALCKQQIQAQTTLPQKAKAKLEAICERAAKGDEASIKRAAREVCEEVIKSSPVPPGPAREQALAACKSR